jgi:tetratricopeptide (TPR) repeat protein
VVPFIPFPRSAARPTRCDVAMPTALPHACWICLEPGQVAGAAGNGDADGSSDEDTAGAGAGAGAGADAAAPEAEAGALVRGCACRGDAGFAHLRCLIKLARQDDDRWWSCPTCKQDYYGQVQLGLARARWEPVRDKPADDEERLAAAADLARALQQVEGDFDQALPLLEQCLAEARRAKGDQHRDTLASCNNLATLHFHRKDYGAALPLAEEALAGTARNEGPEHVDTLICMSELSQLHRALGNHDAALPLTLECLAIRRRTLGAANESTIESMNSLATLYAEMGEIRKAIEIFDEELAACRRTLGSEHPNTLTSICMSVCARGRFSSEILSVNLRLCLV